MKLIKKLIQKIKDYRERRKHQKYIDERMKELRKRDPFTYNH